MRKIIYIFVFVILHGLLWAQQPAQFSMFHLNKYGFNPAYGGMDGVITGTGVYRSQWQGLAGNPTSIHLNAHAPYYRISGGMGFQGGSDQAGVHRHNYFQLSYNYVTYLTNDLLVSAGAFAGVRQRVLDGSKLISPEGQYGGGGVNHNDPILPVSLESGLAPNIGLGIFVAYGAFEGGISVVNALNNSIALNQEIGGGYSLKRAFFVHGEYQILYNDEWEFTPAVLLKTDLSKTQLDVLLNVKYRDNFFGGVSFRGYDQKSIDALILFGGLRLTPNFTLGYSFDVTLSALNSVSSGTHEIMLIYRLDRALGVGIPEKIIYNPRLL